MEKIIKYNISDWKLRHILDLLKKVNEREEKFLRYRMGIADRDFTAEELETNIMSFLKIKSLAETAVHFNISLERAQALELRVLRRLSGHIQHKDRSLRLKSFLDE